MTDVAALALAVDSSPVVAATGALERMNAEAGRSPERVGRIKSATDALVAALEKNATATSALTARMSAMEAASDRAATSVGKVGTQAKQATDNVIQFTGATQGAKRGLDEAAVSADRVSAAWAKLAAEGARVNQQMTVLGQAELRLRSLQSSGGVQQRPQVFGDRMGAGSAAVNQNLTPQGQAQFRMSSLSSDGSVGVRPGMAAPTASQMRGGRLDAFQAQNLFYQGTDVVASYASGMSLATIAMQQGGQIAPTFMGPGGASIKGVMSQVSEGVSSLANRIGVFGGAVGGATAAVALAITAQQSYATTQLAVARQLAGAGGRTSGLSVSEINAIAEAGGGGLSVRERRAGGGELASAGLRGQMVTALLGTAKDYAATTGQDQSDAIQQLGAAFANPTQGAEALNKQLGFLNATTAENVQRLQAQGDKVGAQRVLFDAYNASLIKSAELTTGWGRVTDAAGNIISDIWDKIGGAVDRVVTGGDLEARIKDAERVLNTRRGVAGYLPGFAGDPLVQSAEKDLADLVRQRTEQQQRATTAQQAARSREADAILKSLNPATEGLKKLEDQAANIRRPFGTNWIDPNGDAQRAIDGLAKQTAQMRADLEAGGAGFADSVRNAQFQVKTVGYAPNAMDAAQINKAADDKRLEAMRGASINTDMGQLDKQLASIEAERKLLLEAQQARTVYDAGSSGGRYLRSIADVPEQYRQFYINSSNASGVDVNLLAAQGYKESRFKPNALSPAGAQGIAQFMPDTARAMGLSNPYDPESAIMAQGRLMRQLLNQFNGDEVAALIGYNAGPGRSQKFLASGRDVSVLPRETRDYVASIRNGAPNSGDAVQESVTRTRALELERQQTKALTDAGGEQTAQLRAQQEALKLVSDATGRNQEVSKALADQYAAEARERENLRMAGQFSGFVANDNFARQQLGRDRTDQQAYAAARPYAGTDYYDQVVNRTRDTVALTEAKQMVNDGATTFVSALRRGASASEALAAAFGSAADKLLSKALDSLISGGFNMLGGSGGSGGAGGFLSSLFGGGGDSGLPNLNFGFDAGGYTGHGGRHEIAGIVHKGEVVWSQSDVARYGGAAVVERMRMGYPGYADGGVVGAARSAMAGAGGTQINAPIAITMQGSSGDAARDAEHRDAAAAQLRDTMVSVYREQEARSLQTNGNLWKAGVRRAGG